MSLPSRSGWWWLRSSSLSSCRAVTKIFTAIPILRWPSGISSLGVTAITDKSHIITNYPKLAALLPGVLIIPTVELETPLDKNRTPLVQILSCEFGLPPPYCNVDESDFLPPLSTVQSVTPIYGKTKVGDRIAFRGIPDLGIPCQVSHKKNLIVGGHAVEPDTAA